LARQGLSFRGHADDEGNFRQLLLLRSSDSSDLAAWMTHDHRLKYTSHDMQNELLQIMAHTVVRNIVKDICEHRYFSIIADESTDITCCQQFTLILRHVSHQFEVDETFIGMYEMQKADSAYLASVILDCLTRLNLDIRNARGQGYDGAAVMAGARNGVAAKISTIEPRAVYMHCAGHALNLALQDCSKHVTYIRDALDLIRELVNFIRCSPKRMRLFDEIRQLIPSAASAATSENLSRSSLRPLCPTRWTVRTASLSSVAVSYSGLLQTLSKISHECGDDGGAKASGFLKRLQSFEMYFSIQLALKVFEPAEECSKILQSAGLTAAEAHSSATFTASILREMRRPEKFDLLYDKCVSDADNLELDEPRLGRKTRRPRRYDEGSQAEQYYPETARDKFRQMYNEFIDTAVSCITDRFDNPAFTLFKQIESVLLHCANNNDSIPEEDVRAICNHFGDDCDYEKLTRQLGLLKDICESEHVSHIDTVVSKLKNMGKCSMLMSEVTRLLRLYLVIPASSASAERSFSALRRIKNLSPWHYDE
jgi:hypothetical protein